MFLNWIWIWFTFIFIKQSFSNLKKSNSIVYKFELLKTNFMQMIWRLHFSSSFILVWKINCVLLVFNISFKINFFYSIWIAIFFQVFLKMYFILFFVTFFFSLLKLKLILNLNCYFNHIITFLQCFDIHFFVFS
jgi:hypothetical protein